MGKWVKVPAMHLKPYCCIACGGTPRDDEGDNKPAYFCEAVDVNWADSLFLCETCVRILSELYGAVSPEKVDELRQELGDRSIELNKLKEKHETLQERVDRMIDGVKAKREVTGTKTKKKVAA